MRPLESERRECTTWTDDVASGVAEACNQCHAGDQPAGDYRTTDYLDVLGGGTDLTPNAIAGDPTSMILNVILTDAPIDGHRVSPALAETLRTWVIDCDLAYFQSYIHDSGILNPADGEFHGKLVRDLDWNFARCTNCHGEDFAGGLAQVPCTTCHEEGPTACNTCHGSADNAAPPRAVDGSTGTTAIGVGAHQTHLAGGPLARLWDCAECHVVPERYDDVGHLFLADGAVDELPAEVTFGPFSATTLVPGDRKGPPTWNPQTERCDNIYCHGAAIADEAAANVSPQWTLVEAGEAACGTCHGLPPSDHSRDRCSECHRRVVDSANNIIAPALHINGTVEVGDGSGPCTSCHGSAAGGPAPPQDLDGNASSDAVGAHASHLTGQRLRGPIPCTSCHVVPGNLNTPGHIDSESPAEVFPTDPRFSSLATADGASPVYDPETLTCAGVYCHGSGAGLSDDASANLVRDPSWTQGASAVACGACHGIPPSNADHDPSLGLGDCATCHGASVDSFGAFLFSGSPPTSAHINGVVDGN